MFKTNAERTSSGYIEFQFFDKKLFRKKYWRDDSLYVDVDDYEKNFDFFVKYFNLNFPFIDIHYSKEQTQNILDAIKSSNYQGIENLIKWLEECLEKHNGFDILGV